MKNVKKNNNIFLNKKSLIVKSVSILLGILLSFLVIELFLRGASTIIGVVKNNKNNPEVSKTKIDFVFIGDSWTEGAEASEGMSYPEQFIKRLTRDNKREYTYINLGNSGSNSAMALLSLTDVLKKHRPEYVFCLSGGNDGGNPKGLYSVDLLAYEKYGWKPLLINVEKNLFTFIGFKRLGMLLDRYTNTKLLKNEESLIAKGSLFKKNYNEILQQINRNLPDRGNKEELLKQFREVLKKKYKDASSYKEFYAVICKSFSNQASKAEKYLKKNNLWKPGLVRSVHKRKLKAEKLLSNRDLVYQRNIFLIDMLCNENGSKLVIQTYYYPGKMFDKLNSITRILSSNNNIIMIDHDKIIKEKKYNDNKIFAKHHPNNNGYKIMADNLYKFYNSVN